MKGQPFGKSYFGEQAIQDGKYGTPPPVLIFEYLGHHGFNKVPVILSGYSIELNDSVDYIPVTSVVKAKNSDKLENLFSIQQNNFESDDLNYKTIKKIENFIN